MKDLWRATAASPKDFTYGKPTFTHEEYHSDVDKAYPKECETCEKHCVGVLSKVFFG